jgi:hypothetical protein
LGSLLNEPIRGQGVFWSSAAGREYPIPVRIRSFEAEFSCIDPSYDREPVETYATKLRERSDIFAREAEALGAKAEPPRDEEEPQAPDFELVPDTAATKEQIAIKALRITTLLFKRSKEKESVLV